MAKIKITLKLFVTLTAYLPENADSFEVEEGTSVNTLIQDLNIPAETVKLIFVNGRKQNETYVLEPGDRLGLFPPVGGG